MFEHFTGQARAVAVAALDEARRRGDRRLSTEHVLLGLLHDESAAQALGVDLEAARAGLDDLDREALAVIGIDADGVDRPRVPASAKRTPFTSGAREVFRRSLVQTRAARSRRIETKFLVLALLDARHPDPAAELIGRLGIDPAAVRERLQAA
jgi:ATP-dependent Clp protease ATP-binding subunit ClpA